MLVRADISVETVVNSCCTSSKEINLLCAIVKSLTLSSRFAIHLIQSCRLDLLGLLPFLGSHLFFIASIANVIIPPPTVPHPISLAIDI